MRLDSETQGSAEAGGRRDLRSSEIGAKTYPENHRMMLEHYSQTENMLVSYDENALGFF